MLGVWCEDLGKLLLLRHQKQRNDSQKSGAYTMGPASKLSQMNQLNRMNQLNQLPNKYVFLQCCFIPALIVLLSFLPTFCCLFFEPNVDNYCPISLK